MKAVLCGLVLALVLCMGSTPALGQIVRGTVKERGSGAPLAGVLITLESTDGGNVAPNSVLSDAVGKFAVRGSAGSYRINAKRIGVERYESDSFRLAVGVTRQLDIVLEQLVYQLPMTRIVDASMCVSQEDDRQRVSSLWDEARTALTATNLSRRDRLFQGSIGRYSRHVDPRTLRVLDDSWSEFTGTYERTFVSPSGDSLSRFGYWRRDGASAFYYAPDAEALVSRAFQRDHCFHVVEGGSDQPGMIGLGFEPVPTRKIPDVRGILWMDEGTFALDHLKFTYTQLPRGIFADRVGGEIHYARLESGAWVASRWMLRMPQYVGGNIRGLIEEGGIAFGAGLAFSGNPAAIAGTLLDSAGHPMSDASIRLAGTPFQTASDAVGAFELDSLPTGHFTVIATNAAYEALGTFASQQSVDLREGATERVHLRAQTTSELYERFCPGIRMRRERGVLRIVALDDATNRPLANMLVWMRWTEGYVGRGADLMARASGEEQRTDANGTVVFCDVPSNTPVTLSAVNALGHAARDSVIVRTSSGGITAAQFRTKRP